MITRYKYQRPEKAGHEFMEWASLFSGELFVKVSIYADESGTDDRTGQKPSCRAATVAGFAAPRDNWKHFCVQWQKVLNKYKAPYFHHSEWTYANSCASYGWDDSVKTKKYRGNPYYGWSQEKLSRFRLELAKIAGEGNTLPICGGLNVRGYDELKRRQPNLYDENPYAHCINGFFKSCLTEINLQWPRFKDKGGITVFFDQNNDPVWAAGVSDAFMRFKKLDLRLKEYSFVDKKEILHLPLQAADMLAYRCREFAIEISKNRTVPAIEAEFDKALFHNLNRSSGALDSALTRLGL